MANKKRKKIIRQGIFEDNPIIFQVIGLCSALAVTNSMSNSLVMGLALTFVTGASSFIISLLRKQTPSHVRMVVQVFIIAFFVIIVDMFLRAYMPEMSKTLGPYVGLIITNCIIMGRAEAYAMSNPPVESFIDGAANGIGYTVVLLIVSFFRELLGFGTIFGFQILPDTFMHWTMMVMPPSAFFLLAIVMWIFYNKLNKDKEADK